jgi:hypothetical protein
MKPVRRIVLLLPVIAACCCGCATPGYLGDRWRDAGDIFTCSVGGGAGGRLRAGPLHVGVMADIGTMGLRGGSLQAGLGYDAGELEFLGLPLGHVMDLQPKYCFCAEVYEPGSLRGKGYRAFSGLPLVTTTIYVEEGRVARRFHPYLTQLEFEAGILFVPRIGFNPGELLDFLLGWGGVDIFHDDLGRGAPADAPAAERKGPP